MNTSNASSPRTDVYASVTAKVVSDLERGVRTWLKPWTGDVDAARIILPLRHNGLAYRGINVLLLWSEAIDKGYSSPKWMTYRQAVELGGHVRKGEHGSLIVYADTITKTEKDDKGEEVERDIPYMKGYTVFNVAQIEELPQEYYAKPERQGEKMDLIGKAEQFFAASGAVVIHGGNRAYYAPGPDVIRLPEPEAFSDAESYTSTKAHEFTHWTAHRTRLAREFGKHFGDDAYATGRRTRCGFPLRFAWDYAGGPGRSCQLHRPLAESPEERQAGNLRRSSPRPARGRLPARIA